MFKPSFATPFDFNDRSGNRSANRAVSYEDLAALGAFAEDVGRSACVAIKSPGFAVACTVDTAQVDPEGGFKEPPTEKQRGEGYDGAAVAIQSSQNLE